MGASADDHDADADADGKKAGASLPAPSEPGFVRDGRSHHSAPIVHSLS